MIPFFRKIRKKMADDNRPVKYARYAIGEIILVVIGILIALQINTWNADKKARELEYLTLIELKKNIDTDLKEMGRLKVLMERRVLSMQLVLDELASDRTYQDSIAVHFGRAMVYDDMGFHKGIYESIKFSGGQLINDNNLRFEINNFYDYYVTDMEGAFIELRDDFYNYMLTFLREEFKYYESIEPRAIPIDFESMKQNQNFKLSLGVFMDLQKMSMRKMDKTVKASSDLLTKINQRLDKIEK